MYDDIKGRIAPTSINNIDGNVKFTEYRNYDLLIFGGLSSERKNTIQYNKASNILPAAILSSTIQI